MRCKNRRVLMIASVASMIDQFNMSNILHMQEMGYEVHVACNFEKGNTCSAARLSELKKELKQMHVIWHQWDCPRKPKVVGCIRAGMQLCRLIKTYHFLWMHCHSPVGAAIARIVAYRYDIPVAYTAHGFHFYKKAPLKNWILYYPMEKIFAHRTDILITVNREDYQFAVRHLQAGKVYKIPGVGIDTEKYAVSVWSGEDRRNALKKYGIPENAVVLLSVGELSRRKNHEIVIRALAKIDRQDVYYLICGQGVLKKRLQMMADRLGVGDRLRMPGYKKELKIFYQSADIFVLPSLQEGLPVALMEAMACGLPCVVSDIRGSRELISGRMEKDGSIKGAARQVCLAPGGARFSLRHPQQLQEVLKVLVNDKESRLRCGTHNKKKMKAYSQENVAVLMRKIYKELGNTAAPKRKIRQNWRR